MRLQKRIKIFGKFKETYNPTVIQNIQVDLVEQVNKLAETFKQNNKAYLISLFTS